MDAGCRARYFSSVRLPIDPRFIAEAQRFALRFTCEDCLRYDKDSGACAHEWPNQEHLRITWESPPREVVFCKEFELK